MTAANEEVHPRNMPARLPLWLSIVGTIAFIGSAILAARLIWEQTQLTWEQGPQMVGYSLAHGYGGFLFLFPVLLALWAVTVGALSVGSLIRKRRIARKRWIGVGLVALLLLLMALPQGFWETIFASQMAASPRAGDILVYAAYRGDLRTVKALLAHGVPVGAIEHAEWRTALHAAAVAGDVPLLRYLLSQGSDINALDRSGDSPLEVADSRGLEASARFLQKQGAKRIRGDEAQHQKAIHDQVQEEIERLDRAVAGDKKIQDAIKKAERDQGK